MQSKKHSLFESLVVTLIGMGYAVPLNYVMIHMMSWPDPWTQATVMTIVFTVASIILKYVSRRIFNAITVREFYSQVEKFPSHIPDDYTDGRGCGY